MGGLLNADYVRLNNMFYNRGHSSSCLSTQYEHVGGEVSNNFDVSAKKAELAKAITAVIELRDTEEYKTKVDADADADAKSVADSKMPATKADLVAKSSTTADAKSVADSKMPATKADTAATKKRETGNSDRPSSGASKYRPIKYGYKNLSLSDEDSDKPSNGPSCSQIMRSLLRMIVMVIVSIHMMHQNLVLCLSEERRSQLSIMPKKLVVMKIVVMKMTTIRSKF